MSTHIDQVPDFWETNVCNARHSNALRGSHEYFLGVRAKKAAAEPHIRPFMETHRFKGTVVLDVGCGLGTQAVWFAQAGCYVTATDKSEESLHLALQHAVSTGVETTMIVKKRDYNEAFYPRFPYGLIWAWGSLHHMPYPGQVLQKLRENCSTPYTRLKAMVYHKRSTKALWLWLKHGKDWRHFTEAAEGVPISDAYTVAEARALFEDNGWAVTSCRVTHIFRWRVEDYRKGEFIEAFPWRWMPGPVFKWFERHFGFHILIEARPKS